MKRQDFIKIKDQSNSEINKEISKLQKELVTIKMKQKLGQVKNVRQTKMMRYDIARLKSTVRIKELAETMIKPLSAKGK